MFKYLVLNTDTKLWNWSRLLPFVCIQRFLYNLLQRNFHLKAFILSMINHIYILYIDHDSNVMLMLIIVRHVTGNDQDYLRKIPRAVVQISALL